MNDRAFALRQLPSDAPSLDAGVREFSDESGEPVPAAEWPCARVYETDRAVYDWIAQVERPDGNQKWRSIDPAPIHSDHGTLDRVVIVEQDVTEIYERLGILFLKAFGEVLRERCGWLGWFGWACPRVPSYQK